MLLSLTSSQHLSSGHVCDFSYSPAERIISGVVRHSMKNIGQKVTVTVSLGQGKTLKFEH